MRVPLTRLLELSGGKLIQGDPGISLAGVGTLKDAGPGQLCFFRDCRYREDFLSTQAGAVFIPQEWTDALPGLHCGIIAVADPSQAFEMAVDFWSPDALPLQPGVHPSAVVAPSAKFEPGATSIGPNCVIGPDAEIGAGSRVGAGCFIGEGVFLGRDCVIHPNTTIQQGCILGDRVILHPGVVIGADGFGYTLTNGRHLKVRQAGIVQIDEDVEVGANSTVDRARIGRTWIKAGTKIDNLVQIGHNVVIGMHCLIVSGTAIAGSAVIEDHVTIAGQCGIIEHIRIGAHSALAARTLATRNLPGKVIHMGNPARPAAHERRRLAASQKMPAALKRLKELEIQFSLLENKLATLLENSAPRPEFP